MPKKKIEGMRRFTAELITKEGSHVKAEGFVSWESPNPFNEVFDCLSNTFGLTKDSGKLKSVVIH